MQLTICIIPPRYRLRFWKIAFLCPRKVSAHHVAFPDENQVHILGLKADRCRIPRYPNVLYKLARGTKIFHSLIECFKNRGKEYRNLSALCSQGMIYFVQSKNACTFPEPPASLRLPRAASPVLPCLGSLDN